VAREVMNWAIDEENAMGSDHEVIRFQIESLHPDIDHAPARKHLNWKKTNWDTFTSTLQTLSEATHPRWTSLDKDPTQENVDEWANMLRESIQTAIEASTPTLNPAPCSKRWWTTELEQTWKDMSRAQRPWKRMRLPTHHAEFKTLRNTHFHQICHVKDSLWKEYLSQAEGADVWAAFKYTNPCRAQLTTPIEMMENGEQRLCMDFQSKITEFQALFPPPPPHPAPSTSIQTPRSPGKPLHQRRSNTQSSPHH
jgi:hypothetical protein